MKARAKVSRIATAVRAALLSSSPWLAAHAATLPIPCVSGACGPGVSSFVGAGSASVSQAGSKLTVNQTSANAILNWQSFNISSDGTVQFVQPSASSVALNEIYDSNPTQIFGALDANGRVFLINQNGIIFGSGSQVNVGALVASTLNISPDAVTTSGNNVALSLVTPGSKDEAAFNAFTDASGNPVSGDITVQQGAAIQAADGGEIYMLAANVTNLGTIHTPDGQTILAAGNQVYLAESSTSGLRGMLVEVQGKGMVQNGLASNSSVSSPQQLVGQVIAEHGNISLAALAVNQYGRVNANTSVSENGSIYLKAQNGNTNNGTDAAGLGGTLILGENSDTEVTLDTSDPTRTVDSVAQPKSVIQMSGATVDMLRGSVARATGGEIDAHAAQNLGLTLTYQPDGSRFYMDSGAQLDVSGASITLPVTDNVIAVPLYATELADSPVQRNGPLHGQTVNVDIRAHGLNADGTTWWGTPVANDTGEIQAITRNVVERNLAGGTIDVQSQGDVILAPGSSVNVSGGYIQYTGGYVSTSELLTLWGQAVPIASADPNIPYAGVINSTSTTDAKWGVTQTYRTTPSYYSPGYVEGKDAGSLTLTAPAFIIDGNVNASTSRGLYQTLPTTQPNTATWISGSMYRPYDEVPNGATLRIGTPGGAAADLIVDNVTLASGEVLPGLTNADGSAFNPLIDPLPASLTTSALQPGLVDEFAHVSIYTDGKFIDPAGGALQLPAGGSFTVQAANVDIEGAINAPAGTIVLTAQDTYVDQNTPQTSLTLGGGASLTASGEWINESSMLYPSGNPAPVYIQGGTISLTAANPNALVGSTRMELDPGSVIDVSGGAELTDSGKINAGKGGSITIDAATAPVAYQTIIAPLPAPLLVLGAALRGYGVYQGGSLSISAPGICISGSDCGGGNPSVAWLPPQFFSSGGFGNYAITADQYGLSIAPGTVLQLAQQNLAMLAGYTAMPDAMTLIGAATVAELPLRQRQPVDLSLALEYPDNNNVNFGSTAPHDGITLTGSIPSLTVPQGVLIATDPGGSLALTSNTRLDVEGTLRAPGGRIALTLDGSQALQYDPTQAIWLGTGAVLDASGVAKVFPDTAGNLTGSVLQGGSVSLDAGPGYLELLPGSLIDVSGASGLIDLMAVGGGPRRGERIASAGGAIELSAGEGAVIDSTFRAGPGVAALGANQPAGGTLSLTVDAPQNFVGSPVSTGTIVVSPELMPILVAPGAPVPAALNGQALLPAGALTRGGFGMVALKSYLGTIAFSGGATLSATSEVSLDAEYFSSGDGTAASVQAPYVEFGSSSTPYAASPAPTNANPLTVSGGTGRLNVSGGFIELYGTTGLQGIGAVSFDSSGDLRVRGFQGYNNIVDPNGAVTGGIYADGTIDLTAQQIYPTTLTQFTISADPATVSDLSQLTTGSIVIHGAEGTRSDLLSAGGDLTLSAASITQGGVLRAPFGTIELHANTLTLGSGSLTSTSADGLTIPFGTTQGGTDWVYPLEYSYSAVYGTDGLPPPSQRIVLNANSEGLQSGAVIDVSGGGDLQAYEWLPGTGGTQDILGSSSSFAIVPGLRVSVAPYDPLISTNANPRIGQAVYLSGGSGVSAGTYVLMPARYALLPGAYLVTPMTGTTYQDMQQGQTFKAPGGGTIVAGYETTMGLSVGASRWNGFDVTPASVFMNEAQYNVTSGNQFFSSQEAQALSASATNQAAANAAVSAMRLPQDAGVLELIAGNSLSLGATLRTSAQGGARGAEVDISNPDVVIAADASSVNQSGALVLTSTSLDQLGAQTLLIGGYDGGGVLTTTARTLTVLGGASLSAPQILLAAQNEISVDGGASITAKGSAPPADAYSLADAGSTTNDGAFLAVSAGPQISVERTGATGTQGALDLAIGSTVSAPQGSVYLDATSVIGTQGTLDVTGGNLAVQAPAIALGNAPGSFQGAELGRNVFGSGGLGTLSLVVSNPRGTPAVQVYDGAGVSAQNIVIDAPALQGNLDSGQTATLTASGTLTLGDALSASTASSGSSPSSGSHLGSLILTASGITLGDTPPGATGTAAQQVNIAGFGSVALDTPGAVTAARDVTLTTDSDLSLTSSQVTTAAGVSATVESTGYVDSSGTFHQAGVSMLSPASSTPLSAPAALGGSLLVKGATIEAGTAVDLPSGNVTLVAQSGGITLDSGASIAVAGVTRQYDTSSVATPGGNVSLSATGNINLASGSTIDVSAGAGGTPGTVAITAPAGAVAAQGAITGAGQGASFSIDAGSFDFGALAALVNRSPGAFTGAQSYRLRGDIAGGYTDLTVASTLTAHQVLLEADRGKVDVEGAIDASGSGGGSVTLAAWSGITVNGGIDAHATSPGEKGGMVELDLANDPTAYLSLGGASVINVAGGGATQAAAGSGATAISPGGGGTVLLRVPYDQNPTQPAAGVSLAGAINGASKTVLEVYDVTPEPTDSSGNVDITAIDPAWQSYVQTISGAESATLAQLTPSGSWNFRMEPGIEIDAPGSITLDTPLDLNSTSWRAVDPATGTPDIPGVLTFRAGSGVNFNDTLSDAIGPVDATGFPTLSAQSSWSYRIVAGADSGAADPLAATGSYGDVTIGSATSNGVVVRTGDGFIDVAASRDFILGSPTSALYTAGVQSGSSLVIKTCNPRCISRYAPDYATDGGDINVTAGRNILGAPTDQFVNAWLWRFGVPVPSGRIAVGWSVDFGNFSQGVAALGGGDVTIRAGADIRDFSASIASIGVADTGGGATTVEGGGRLSVDAGGSIQGGSYYVGLGNMTLAAGNSVGIDQSTQLAPLLGLGEASASVTARGDLALSGIVTPTLLNLGALEPSGFTAFDYSSYGTASAATLVSIGGDVNLDDQRGALDTAYASSFANNSLGPPDPTGGATVGEVVLPPVVDMSALSGSINISRDVTLFPSLEGNLRVLAGANITIGEGAQVVVPDADPTAMPTIATPALVAGTAFLGALQGIAEPFSNTPDASYQHGASPLFQPVAAFDENPVLLIASGGDIAVSSSNNSSGLWSAKPVIVSAGQDVANLNLVAQNLTSGDVTSVTAGRDVIYATSRTSGGAIDPNQNGIVVAGPGALQIAAGRNVDLGTSNGITTIGNTRNAALPSSGASVSVEAGVGPSAAQGAAQYASFIKQYIEGTSAFDADLLSYVEQATGQGGISSDDARQAFAAMPAEEQRAFVEQIFFELLRTYGEEAAKSGNNADFAGAYAAIEKLFPGANAPKGATVPYTGNISLYFSRIFTSAGGGISLLAPGGGVNAGLALAPVSYNLSKDPQQLGIVAAGAGDVNSFTHNDFLVNQSRVFAADGGNILVWSTEGNIDAGRGSKTSLSAAAPTANYDLNGFPTITYFPPTTGSGIQALADTPGVSPGSVDLFAPHGVVNANEAGIVAGNLTIAATAVLGANNISVSGISVGVPTTVTGLGTQSLAGSTAAGGATSSAQSSVAQNTRQERRDAPQAEAALRWLDVFVLGFGEETCSANDVECLKRQKHSTH